MKTLYLLLSFIFAAVLANAPEEIPSAKPVAIRIFMLGGQKDDKLPRTEFNTESTIANVIHGIAEHNALNPSDISLTVFGKTEILSGEDIMLGTLVGADRDTLDLTLVIGDKLQAMIENVKCFLEENGWQKWDIRFCCESLRVLRPGVNSQHALLMNIESPISQICIFFRK